MSPESLLTSSAQKDNVPGTVPLGKGHSAVLGGYADLSQVCTILFGKTCPALIQAAARIDLARARLFLGEDMEGEASCSRLTCSPDFSESN